MVQDQYVGYVCYNTYIYAHLKLHMQMQAELLDIVCVKAQKPLQLAIPGEHANYNTNRYKQQHALTHVRNSATLCTVKTAAPYMCMYHPTCVH